MISIAVFSEGLHHNHRPIIPLSLVTNQSSKVINSLGNTKRYSNLKSDLNDQTIRFHSSTPNSNFSSSLKNRHIDVFENLENPIEKTESDSSFFTGTNQIETHLKDSQIHSNKMNNLKRISNGPNNLKLVPNDLKDREHLFLSALANLHTSYSSVNHLPISYYVGPQELSITKNDRSILRREPRYSSLSSDTSVQSQREGYMPLERMQWHGERAMNPHYENKYNSKPYLDRKLSYDKQFRIDYEEPREKNSPEFKVHTLTKQNYENIPQHSSRLLPHQSQLFSNEDNDSQYTDAGSSKEFQIPNRGSHQSFQKYQSPPTEFKMQLPKNSYFKLGQDANNDRPAIHLSSSLGKPRNSDSHHIHVKQDLHSERHHHFLPHQKEFPTPSKRIEMPTNLNRHSSERNVLNPIQPSFRSFHQENLQNSHLNSPQYFDAEDSGDGTFSQSSESTEISTNHRPFPGEYNPLDLKGITLPHYQEKQHDSLSISDKENFQPYLPSPDSNQSRENIYFPRHLKMENDKSKDGIPNYNNKYSNEEDILAARVKAILNPSGNPDEKDSPHSGKNLPSQNRHIHYSPIINSHIPDVHTGKDMRIKNSTVSGRDGDIEGLGSDPEPDSETESEDDKDGVSEEEEHDGFLDMGAYSDKQGSFGWYADFPVGRGHDKVSYSSS